MEIVLLLQNFATPWLDKLALLVTNLGSEQVYICLLVTIYLAIDSSIGQRLGIYLLLSFYINFLLKGLFNTPRPFEINPDVLRSGVLSSELTENRELGAGFPSGHAQASMTFWGLLALSFHKFWLYIFAAIVVLLISLSRIYLGVHFLNDVLGGLLMGIALVAFAFGLNYALGDFSLNSKLTVVLGIILPLLFHLFLPTVASEKLLGILAAFFTAPIIFKHHVPKTFRLKLITTLTGIVLVFVVLVGSSLLIPEHIKDHAIWGFLRYLAIGYTGTLFVPWLASKYLALES